jgi:hypothetical protein
MPFGGLLTTGLISAGSGILGNVLGASDRRAAQAAQQKAFDDAMAMVGDPELAKELVLQQYKSAGTLTPEMEKEINATASQMGAIKEDPGLRNAQMSALAGLQERGRAGMTAIERAQLNKTRNDVARDAQAKQAQIMQSFAARGQGGTGAELTAALQSAQSGDERMSEESDRLAAMAQQNALQALSQSGTMGGQIRSQDFENASAKAKAADAINQFNVQNAMNRQTRNVGAGNTAQAANLSNLQDVSNKNVSGANTESSRARDIRLEQAKAKADLLLGKGSAQAKNLNESAGRTEKMVSGIGEGLGKVSSATGGFGAANLFNKAETGDQLFEYSNPNRKR